MLGDHFLGRHFWSDRKPLLLELLLGLWVDDLGILALVARLLLRFDVLAILVITHRCRLPFLTIIVLVVVDLRAGNVRIVIAQTAVGTYARGARAYSGR